jgi:signal transduction histidine kinase
MTLNSLAFRLFATAAAWTLIIVPLAGMIIYGLYRQEVETGFDRRIELLLKLIVADAIDNGGTEPGVPKDVGEIFFEITHSGWYWQIKPLDDKPGRQLVSTSLASETLALPSDANTPVDDREFRWANLLGPIGQRIRVAETVALIGEGQDSRRYSVAVAGWLEEPEGSLSRFRWRLWTALSLVGLGLLAMTLLQVRFGLYPLRKVERSLAAIRSGDATRLDGAVPAEIEPLQAQLNALLVSNEEIIERARTQVGNLAHALKTPLAVLVNEAASEKTPLASKVSEQATLMRDQVQHYLDRARMAARAGAIGRATEVKPVADSIARALTRIYQEKGITFTVDCDASLRFQGEKQDLEEMLGNLLDNAAKWSTSRVTLTAEALDSVTGNKTSQRNLAIRVEDDGSGLTDEQLAQPVKRGRRLDETKPGSGLGHSIVADLAHSYRGKFSLARSKLGGLEARLVLPSA